MWVQKEIGSLRREINSGGKRAGKNEDSANLIRRLADLHHLEVLLKQPSPGRNSSDGWMEGGTRHAEKDDIFAIEGLSELMKKRQEDRHHLLCRDYGRFAKRRSGPPRTD